MMKSAVMYARVSSKDQEREGYSIPAQLKLLREYATRNDFQVLREFVDVETAKVAGRKQFGEMVQFFQQNNCRIVIVEKTDRLYRNFRDCVTLEDLGVEIHLPKEGQIIGKDARSQTKLMHGIQVVIARNYIENLREEVRKGMREKAEQGIYPSRPPLGYRNNKLDHTIEIDPNNAPIAKRIFELYATGSHSLGALRNAIRTETGRALPKGYLHKILRNPFYSGYFVWQGRTYKGTQPLIVDPAIYAESQEVLNGNGRTSKYRKHAFAFSGLLTCAHDGCTITAEIKKGKYTYYRCTGHRGKCETPYLREEVLADQLGAILKGIYIPDDVAAQLTDSLDGLSARSASQMREQLESLKQRLTSIQRRIDRAYLDKLDGKVSENFWQRKATEWQMEADQV